MKNYGISLGWRFPLMEMVIVLVWVFLVWFSYREKSWWLKLAVLGGCLNIIERLWKGYVTDYWKIPGLPIYNNVNDWLIFMGIGMYIWKKLK